MATPLRKPDVDETHLLSLRREFGQRLARLATHWRREIDLELRQFSLTDATWRPLYYLRSLPPPVRQTDLARALSVEGSSLVRILDVLERQKLVARETDPADRRSKLISLTRMGSDVADQVLLAADTVAARFLGNVQEESLNECLTVLDDVWSALQSHRQAETTDGRPR